MELIMKFSVSTYSFSQLMRNGKKTEKDLIPLTKEMGFDGIEFAEIHIPDGMKAADYAEQLREECEKVGITPVNYTIGANFLYPVGGTLESEIERLCKELDIAKILGVSGMRHDATGGWKSKDRKQRGFTDALPYLIEGCRKVTEYGESLGIRTMIENHGFFCQESSRVEQIVNGVSHTNFGLLFDMGNFLCADEDPIQAVGRLSPYVYHVHAKDFHFKSGDNIAPVNGFFKTRGGNYLRGAIIGHGCVPVLQCMSTLQDSGYDGFISVEFEGVEDAETGVEWGLNTLTRCDEVLKG